MNVVRLERADREGLQSECGRASVIEKCKTKRMLIDRTGQVSKVPALI